MKFPFLHLLFPALLLSVGCAGNSPATAATSARSFTDYRQAVPYINAMMEKAEPAIRFHLNGVTESTLNSLVKETMKSSNACRMRFTSQGSAVTLQPTYTDDTLLLAALRYPEKKAQLTARQKKVFAELKETADKVCRTHSGEYERALALHDYIVSTYRYTESDSSTDASSVTCTSVATHRAVCDGYARVYHILLHMAGIESRLIVGRTSDGVNHVWNLVKLSGRYTHIDCTFDDPVPDISGRVIHNYFGMNDSMIARGRTWERNQYPAAYATDLYYPTTRGERFDTVADFIQACRPLLGRTSGLRNAYIKELSNGRINAKIRIENVQKQLRINAVSRLMTDNDTPGIITYELR